MPDGSLMRRPLVVAAVVLLMGSTEAYAGHSPPHRLPCGQGPLDCIPEVIEKLIDHVACGILRLCGGPLGVPPLEAP